MADNEDNHNEIVTTLRLPSHIHKAVTAMAKINRRSFNAQAVTALENDVARSRDSSKTKS